MLAVVRETLQAFLSLSHELCLCVEGIQALSCSPPSRSTHCELQRYELLF